MFRPTRHHHARIWDAVGKIPHGRVSTYGAIARLCGLNGQPRLVGYALHNLPPGADIPWHRVINAKGMISLHGEAGRHQRSLLLREGVVFVHNRIDLRCFGWPSKRVFGRQARLAS